MYLFHKSLGSTYNSGTVLNALQLLTTLILLTTLWGNSVIIAII